MATACQVADATIALWFDVDTSLQPFLGEGGVAALFHGSLSQTARVHPCLSFDRTDAPPGIDLPRLHAALARHPPAATTAAAQAWFGAFHDLLASLLGPALTETLLQPVRSAGLLAQLPPRSLFADRLEQAIANARRRGAHCAVLVFHIDEFRCDDDRPGLAVGDAVLALVAARLSGALRSVDTASHPGGGAFLVLLSEVARPADAPAVADKLAAAIAAPAVVDGRSIALRCNVGVALFPDDGGTGAALVAAAEAAAGSAAEAANCAGRHRPARPPPPTAPAPALGPPVDDAQERLRAANERLVQTALAAQSQQVQADAARRRQLVRMSALLARLLAASRLDAGDGGIALDRETLDLRTVVAAAVTELQPVAHGRRQVVQWQPPRQTLPVHCDALQLHQLLAQLLENACRHSPDGASIVVVVDEAGDRVVLSVRDPGPPTEMPQTDSGASDPAGPGFGLAGGPGVGPGVGMRLAQVLAQVHGGSLEVISRGVGQGGELLLTLPRAAG